MLTNCHGNDPPCAVRSRSTGNRLNRLLPVFCFSLCARLSVSFFSWAMLSLSLSARLSRFPSLLCFVLLRERKSAHAILWGLLFGNIKSGNVVYSSLYLFGKLHDILYDTKKRKISEFLF